MLYRVSPGQFPQKTLLEPLDEHLCVTSLLRGLTSGQILADDPADPAALFVDVGVRLFLSGAPKRPSFLAYLRAFLQQVYLPCARAAGQDAFLLHPAGADWEPYLPALLDGLDPHNYQRQYFEATSLCEDWRAILPSGFTMLPVDAQLLEQGYANTDALRTEMCSERASVEEFLAHSFGVSILHDGALVSWCLSEYNTDRRCEVGIATVEEYQRRGLGLAVALALVEQALENGYQRIGWHCWKNNRPSALLAERAGFRHIADLPVWLCYWQSKPAYPAR